MSTHGEQTSDNMKKSEFSFLLDIAEISLLVAAAWSMSLALTWLASERSQRPATLALETILVLLLYLICAPKRMFPEKWRNSQQLRTAIAPLAAMTLYITQLITFETDTIDMASPAYGCSAVFWAVFVKWGWGTSIRQRAIRLLVTPAIIVAILQGAIWFVG